MKKLISILLLWAILSATNIAAPLYYGALENNIGARATAFNQAYTALADSPEALHWNPAGLASQSNTEIAAMYATLFDEVQTRWVSVSTPLAGGIVSLGYHGMMVPNNITTDSLGNAIGNFNFIDDAIILGYAHMLDQWQVGVSVKCVRQEALEQNLGTNMDIGVIYNAEPFSVGLVAADILNTPLGPDSFAHKIRLGIAYRADNLLLTGDMHYTINRNTITMLGAEYRFCDEFSILGGFGQTYSLGARLKVLGFAIDYAFTPHDLGCIHYFQVGIRL